MEKPGWATFVGIFMLLIAGCGAIDNYSDMNADKFKDIQSEIYEDIENEQSAVDRDTIEVDSAAQERIGMFGDSIVRDSSNNVDMAATMKNIMKISDYRISWTRKFGYIGMVFSILFAISGIFFLTRKKYTIQLGLGVLALSLAFGIFQFIIFRADTGSSQMISKVSNIEVYISIFIDIILLICIMVLDKSYYQEEAITEDYYD